MRAALWLLLFSALAFGADPAPPAAGKAETYVVLPEPLVMRSSLSHPFAGSRRTVFSPAQRGADGRVRLTTKEEFAKLGVSWDTFLERAQAAADRRLAAMQPELKRDESGKVLYAVYRGDDPTIACLLIAPALGAIFKNIFGEEVWLVAPDRNSLFVFRAGQGAIEEFAEDLRERFDESPFAVSDEIFGVKSGAEPRVVGSFARP